MFGMTHYSDSKYGPGSSYGDPYASSSRLVTVVEPSAAARAQSPGPNTSSFRHVELSASRAQSPGLNVGKYGPGSSYGDPCVSSSWLVTVVEPSVSNASALVSKVRRCIHHGVLLHRTAPRCVRYLLLGPRLLRGSPFWPGFPLTGGGGVHIVG